LDVEFGKAVWKDTDKRGVDVVLDSVGQPVWVDCLRALAPYGRLVTYGRTAGNTGPTNIPLVFWKQLSILGSTMGTPAEYRRVMGLVFDGTFEPVIHEVLPLDEIRRAHEMLEAGDVFGKLVITP
jgi:NADPH2:quinone reductase